jgi:hypothetical protein
MLYRKSRNDRDKLQRITMVVVGVGVAGGVAGGVGVVVAVGVGVGVEMMLPVYSSVPRTPAADTGESILAEDSSRETGEATPREE